MPSLWSGRPAISEDSASGFVASLLGAIAAFASCTGEPSSLVSHCNGLAYMGGAVAPHARADSTLFETIIPVIQARAGAGGNFCARCTVA